ncbi:hypothetical protein C8J56DRAFT_1059800 [Mycena floridula]|nr:hypothetical protein C8J56DRAFT_1059800 [Mycena floridula]
MVEPDNDNSSQAIPTGITLVIFGAFNVGIQPRKAGELVPLSCSHNGPPSLWSNMSSLTSNGTRL